MLKRHGKKKEGGHEVQSAAADRMTFYKAVKNKSCNILLKQA